MKREATQAFASGVQAELRALNPTTAASLRKLADKLATWNANPDLQLQYRHQALWLEFNASRKENRGADGEILTMIAKQLEGANIPLTGKDQDLRDRYLAQPEIVFSEADSETRLKCARAFYALVMHTRISRDASPDGKNGYAIAARIEKELPEYASEIPVYQQKERDYHVARVGTMTRKELNELITRFEPLAIPEFVADLKKRWLLAREENLEPSDVTGLVELGDEYLLLVNDQESAIRIYKKAYSKSPTTQLISDKLTELDLVLHKGNWIPKGDIPPPPADPLAAAIRDGEVKEGMNADQVRSALGIEPTPPHSGGHERERPGVVALRGPWTVDSVHSSPPGGIGMVTKVNGLPDVRGSQVDRKVPACRPVISGRAGGAISNCHFCTKKSRNCR